jgi:hypothetical protein
LFVDGSLLVAGNIASTLVGHVVGHVVCASVKRKRESERWGSVYD